MLGSLYGSHIKGGKPRQSNGNCNCNDNRNGNRNSNRNSNSNGKKQRVSRGAECRRRSIDQEVVAATAQAHTPPLRLRDPP